MPKLVDRLQRAELPRRQQRPAGARACRLHRRRPRHRRAALGITAADGRRRALRRLRPAHRLDHLHPVQPVPGDPGGRPALPADRADARPHLPAPAPAPADAALGRRRGRRAARRRCRSPTLGQFPAATLSFDLAPGASLGDAVDAIQQAEQAIGLPTQLHHAVPGRRRRLPDSPRQRALADAGGGDRGLHRAGRALRELHPPAHHPLDAALGRRRRAAGADARRAGSRRDRHHRHHPADRHRQEERDHDDRLRARRRARRRAWRRATRSTRPRCCASGRS